ncbi:MAG TPA: sensor domain-containing diguanylate cyclase [Blastocatellia bacterium]|nr:sensor domain-containing diguanylate cyclase [Blastocatellia bacterium]
MYSLFYVLNNQHGDDFAPFRCSGQTVSRLVRYFEDVVTENKLSALVIEGRCLDGDPALETERLSKLSLAARHHYLFSCDRACATRTWAPEKSPNLTELEEREYHSIETGPFILVMDSRFSGLLASYSVERNESNVKANYELLWTFDPNVVFTAIEYLMARINVQKPWERARFENLLNSCTPHSSSIRMALSFTTKLAMLMQKQNELETAINSISSAISSTLELEPMLQSAVDEVGRSLKTRRAALVLWEERSRKPESMTVYERSERADLQPDDDGSTPASELDGPDEGAHTGDGASSSASALFPPHQQPASPTRAVDADSRMKADGAFPLIDSPVPASGASNFQFIVDSSSVSDAVQAAPKPAGLVTPGPIEAPVTYRNDVIGVLVVEDDTPGRRWESEEMLMVRTVADQLAVAISHARLFKQVQTQARTDSLTNLSNHGYFKERLDREVRLAERNQDTVSLILLDLDHLKVINDTFGHRAGDECLIHVANKMRSTVREVDVCARYGGEEFVIILPQCGREDAFKVAERLRESIANAPIPKIGQISASIGVATYPSAAQSCEELIEMADRAMYLAKAAGRNRVRTLSHRYPNDPILEPLS